MNVASINNGDRFVLQGRGGVWVKKSVEEDTGMIKAKCVFGQKDEYEKEFSLEPNLFCYLIYPEKSGKSEKAKKPEKVVRAKASDTVRIKIVNDITGKLVKDLRVNHITLTAIYNSDSVSVVPRGRSESKNFHVCEVGYDLVEECCWVKVMSEREEEKDGK